MAISNLIAFFIILTAASTLHAHGVTDIATATQAAGGSVRVSVVRTGHCGDGPSRRACSGGVGGVCCGRGAALARWFEPQPHSCPPLLWGDRVGIGEISKSSPQSNDYFRARRSPLDWLESQPSLEKSGAE